MRKLAIFAFLLLAVAQLCAAVPPDWTNPEHTKQLVEKEQAGSGTVSGADFANAGWTSRYRELALAAALIVAIMTALAYGAGHLFESEALKSWGRMELVQAFGTVVLAAALLGVIGLMDYTMEESAKNIVSPCGPEGAWDWAHGREFAPGTRDLRIAEGSTRATQYATCYIDNLYEGARTQSRAFLFESLESSKMAYTSTGATATNWILLYFGFNVRTNAHMRLKSEISGIRFEMLSNMMNSLAAQRFLVGNIASVLGPSCLLIGILLRAFAFSRKAGGLLMAIAAGLLIVLPSAYLLAWTSLVVAVYGPGAIGVTQQAPDYCPAECKMSPPVAFKTGSAPETKYMCYCHVIVYDDQQHSLERSNGYETNYYDSPGHCMDPYPAGDLYTDATCDPEVPITNYYGPPGTSYTAEQFSALNLFYTPPGGKATRISFKNAEQVYSKGYVSCYPDKELGVAGTVPKEISDNCPTQCRELPFPYYAGCSEYEESCNKLPQQCKFVRQITQVVAGGKNYCEKWNDNNATGCRETCKDGCKNLLPQISYSSPDKSQPVFITASDCGVCSSCPVRCRTFDRATGKLKIDPKDDACKSGPGSLCQPCYDQLTKSPPDYGCFYGISSMADASGCNDRNMCGEAKTISELGGDRSVCPVECRIFFENNEKKFRDKAYVEKCMVDFKDACDKSRCPDICKVNATEIPGVSNSGNAALYQPPLQDCSIPPKYEQSAPDYPLITEQCDYCPVACRFKNPTPFAVIKDPFLSKSNVEIECKYSDKKVATTGGAYLNPADCKALQGPAEKDWTYMDYGHMTEVTIPNVGTFCTPFDKNTQLFELAEANSACPKYYNEHGTAAAPYTKLSGNKHASPECGQAGLEAMCTDPKCNYAECTANWPKFCTYNDPNDKTKGFKENYCPQCPDPASPPNFDTGSQCQVKLKYSAAYYGPALCKPECYTDPPCDTFCHPTIELKDGPVAGTQDSCNVLRSILERNDTSQPGNELGQFWGDCGACPYFCRYDYGNAPKPAVYDEQCGIKMLDDLRYRDMPPDPGQKYWVCPNLDDFKFCEKNSDNRVVPQYGPWQESEWRYQLPYSECTAQGWSCSVKVPSQTDYWACTPNIGNPNPPSDPCHGFFPSDAAHPQDWWTDPAFGCGANTYCESLPSAPQDLYECAYSDPYPGLNAYLKDKLDVTVCGQVGDAAKNPEYNWCGETSDVNNKKAVSCNAACFGSFANSDLKACLASIKKPDPPTDVDSCLGCPSFCRILVPPGPPPTQDVPAYCNPTYASFLPSCSFDKCGENCRISSDSQISDPGLHIGLTPPVCGVPNTGPGKLCPARCRIGMEGVDRSKLFGCATNPACNEVIASCTAQVPVEPCATCAECETDCLSQPYVRQNCDEACVVEPDDGIIDTNPSSLLDKWPGAPMGDKRNRAIGSFGIAAMVLPLFALAITIAFVRVLSPLLGGDVEIPGLLRFL